MDPVCEELEGARQELLDLSLRNRLLNHRLSSARGVEIVDERPEDVFRRLVAEGKTFSFLASEKAAPAADDPALGQPEETADGKAEGEKPPESAAADGKLSTPYASAVLQKRLLRTYLAARTALQEQGVNVLYVAVGMLVWREDGAGGKDRRAPLVLVPAELSRASVRARFRLRWSEEDLGDNLSLGAKLSREFGVALPSIEESEELVLSEYFDRVEAAIRPMETWKVDRNAIVLGFFSFGRFLMYHDLDPDQWPDDASPAEHPVVLSLLGRGFSRPSSPEGVPAPEIPEPVNGGLDETLPPGRLHQVMDADSSQTLAILEANRGGNLVIQGPPGTGKSQTITNLVAEFLGRGKTVLFVSEKMAALEVVKRRLDKIGLGAPCLELHSHKARKKLLIDELSRTLELAKPDETAEDDHLTGLTDSRRRLNAYCRAVNDPVGPSGVSPYRAYGELLSRRGGVADFACSALDDGGMAEWTGEDFRRRHERVREHEALLHGMGPVAAHPFRGSAKRAFVPSEVDELRRECAAAEAARVRARETSHAIAERGGAPPPESPAAARRLAGLVRRLADGPDLSGLPVENDAWLARREEIDALLAAGRRRAELRARFEGTLIPEAWGRDVLPLRQALLARDGKWFSFVFGDYRRAKRELAALCAAGAPKSSAERMTIVDAIREEAGAARALEEDGPLAETLFGPMWHGASSNWDELTAAAGALAEFHRGAADGSSPREWISLPGADWRGAGAAAAIDEAEAAVREWDAAMSAVSRRLELTGDPSDSSFADVEKALGAWGDDAPRLQEIVAYNHQRDELAGDGLGAVVDAAADWDEAGTKLALAFEVAWYEGVVERATKERTDLAAFSVEAHERRVDRFCELDRLLLERNRPKLVQAHWKGLPRYVPGSGLGVLKREVAKKRRHLPIRKLMEKAGEVIQSLKPVFMMSPMSVAKFLPAGSVRFDLVVFDEASQVRPVDAFGSILRGSQVVVVGDSRQLPPTSFFDRSVDDLEDEEESVADLESILDLFVARGASERMLRWHYRSLHESLISVSNREFYDNRLVVFPSPDAGRKELGLVFHHLPDATYDRGGTRTNAAEAAAVARAVMKHARARPDWTLGVAAFSLEQMEAIQDEVERLRREQPDAESFFNAHADEPFFVKNLESVQGDERDVIYISIGYGRSPEGELTMNFGPLNREGGERRLNVLITRSKRRCEVFSNLTGRDLDPKRTRARGVTALRRFLIYAETGELEGPGAAVGTAVEPFERRVAERLAERGYRADERVGAGGVFVDLAVRDPDDAERYLVAVECDGPDYGGALWSRDRDRTLPFMLNRLGWKAHRIWSPEWFRNPDGELDRLVATIESARKKKPAG